MSHTQQKADFNKIEVLDEEAIEVCVECPNVSVSESNINKKETASSHRIQSNATSMMSQTMSSVTEAFGKQYDSFSKQQSVFNQNVENVKKKTEIAFMPSGERLNQTNRFDTHLSTDEISDNSSTRNSSSLLHDKLYEQNSILRKEIEHLVDDNYGAVQNKLQQLQTNQNVAQIYFQESVVSMQAAKSTSDELLSSLEKLNETAKSIKFPSKKNARSC